MSFTGEQITLLFRFDCLLLVFHPFANYFKQGQSRTQIKSRDKSMKIKFRVVSHADGLKFFIFKSKMLLWTSQRKAHTNNTYCKPYCETKRTVKNEMHFVYNEQQNYCITLIQLYLHKLLFKVKPKIWSCEIKKWIEICIINLIIHRFYICEFNYILKFICNPKNQYYCAFMFITRHVQSRANLSYPICMFLKQADALFSYFSCQK